MNLELLNFEYIACEIFLNIQKYILLSYGKVCTCYVCCVYTNSQMRRKYIWTTLKE